MKKNLVVIFNMTPRSGKDTAVNYMKGIWEGAVHHLSFKDMLIEATIKFFNVSRDWWDNDYDAPHDNQRSIVKWKKDLPCPELMLNCQPISKRQALGHVSENVLKPLFGKGIFGHQVADRLDPFNVNMISDGGFSEELIPIIEKSHVLILKRDRTGNGWQGDTRGWISHPDAKEVWVGESDDVEAFCKECHVEISKWLEELLSA